MSQVTTQKTTAKIQVGDDVSLLRVVAERWRNANGVPTYLCRKGCKMQRKPKGFIFQMHGYEKVKLPAIYEWAVFQSLVYHLFQTQATFSHRYLLLVSAGVSYEMNQSKIHTSNGQHTPKVLPFSHYLT